ncbi:hypothetical protein ARMGADRAFT_1022030 [Armillaria gallica]|uniref:Uncharacterized protein n=1 Tax=Armillaria gallica TaxID=47427 RepID=A0A2H3EB04_ARMGA|nr:hypothetical protein ARMGADRAFT_1022030 [Armillaria gallica]
MFPQKQMFFNPSSGSYGSGTLEPQNPIAFAAVGSGPVMLPANLPKQVPYSEVDDGYDSNGEPLPSIEHCRAEQRRFVCANQETFYNHWAPVQKTAGVCAGFGLASLNPKAQLLPRIGCCSRHLNPYTGVLCLEAFIRALCGRKKRQKEVKKVIVDGNGGGGGKKSFSLTTSNSSFESTEEKTPTMAIHPVPGPAYAILAAANGSNPQLTSYSIAQAVSSLSSTANNLQASSLPMPNGFTKTIWKMLGKEQSKGVDDDDVAGMAWVKKRLEETGHTILAWGEEQSKGMGGDVVGRIARVKKRLEETERKMRKVLEAMKVRAAKETERVSLSPLALTPPSSSSPTNRPTYCRSILSEHSVRVVRVQAVSLMQQKQSADPGAEDDDSDSHDEEEYGDGEEEGPSQQAHAGLKKNIEFLRKRSIEPDLLGSEHQLVGDLAS